MLTQIWGCCILLNRNSEYNESTLFLDFKLLAPAEIRLPLTATDEAEADAIIDQGAADEGIVRKRREQPVLRAPKIVERSPRTKPH